MRKLFTILFATAGLISMNLGLAGAAGPGGTLSPEMGQTREVLSKALAEVGLPKGDKRLLVLTNAGYGQIGPQTTEPFLDVAQEVAGCSLARPFPAGRSLLDPGAPLGRPAPKGLGTDGFLQVDGEGG